MAECPGYNIDPLPQSVALFFKTAKGEARGIEEEVGVVNLVRIPRHEVDTSRDLGIVARQYTDGTLTGLYIGYIPSRPSDVAGEYIELVPVTGR